MIKFRRQRKIARPTLARWVLFVIIAGAIFAKLVSFKPNSASQPGYEAPLISLEDTSIANPGQPTSHDNDWIVLVTVTDGFYDFLLNWVAFYIRLQLSNQVVIVAEDAKVFQKLQNQRLPPGFNILQSEFQLEDQETDEFQSFHYRTKNYLKLVDGRAGHVLNQLEKGKNVLYTDLDTVWRKSPFPFLRDRSMDLIGQIERDDRRNWKTLFGFREVITYCTGFFAVRSNEKTINFVRAWKAALEPNLRLNQPIFNKLLKKANLVYKPLPEKLFPSGKVYFLSSKTSQEAKEKAVVVHCSFVLGHSNKVGRLKEDGLWSPLGVTE